MSIDASAQSKRSRSRHKRVFAAAVASALARSLQFASMLLYVPVTLRFLGSERFGLWMTISSLLSMLSFADFGIGNGLLNALADADGRNDRTEGRQFVSTGAVLLAGIATLLLLTYVAVDPFINFANLFNLHSQVARSEAKDSARALAICFALSLPLGIVQRVQLGHQDGFTTNLWQAVGTVLSLGFILAAVFLRWSLPFLVFTFAISPVVALAMSSIVEFGTRRPWLRPRLSLFRADIARRLLSSGALFFVSQLGTVFIVNGASVVIANQVGAEAVAPYSIALRPIQALSLLTSIWAMPLWPAYAEAAARGDYGWIRSTLRRTVLLGFGIAASAAVVFFLTYRVTLGRWVGPDHVPDRLTVASGCVFLIAHSVRWTASMCLNGLGRLRSQVAYQLGVGALALAACIVFKYRATTGSVTFIFATAEVVIAVCLASEAFGSGTRQR
jgi:O-antigen/teichoic acid export membrane protein